MMILRNWCGYCLVWTLLACSSDPVELAKVVEKQAPEQDLVEEPASSPPVDENCLAFSPIVDKLPYYFSDLGLVLIDVAKPCSRGKLPGYEKASSWLAMGFPCSAGGAKIDWRGSYYLPQLVVFELDNACPMAPSLSKNVHEKLSVAAGLSEENALLAYYPFAPAYWELADGSDADIGHRIELATLAPEGKRKWINFRAGQSIELKLYGKANALMPLKHWYEVEAQLLLDSENTYKLKVLDAHLLDESQLIDVKKRCEALEPRRKCDSVFP